jgi:threonine dehydrogenase-like Zn-dependent dehydrogenase
VRAWGVVPGTRRVQVVTRPEPGPPGPGEVLLEVLACGVCGTDRHLVAMDRVRPEPGQEDLVLGHEPLARVLAVGPGVAHLREGDLVSATNQRSCGRCDACLAGEVDFCATGAGLGRGVGGLDGFLRPRLVDDAAHVVPIPSELGEVGVLTEPLAVGEKLLEAMRHAGARQRHRPWGRTDEAWAEGLRVLVGGAGPIGLLVALALRCHGAEVHVLDRVPPASRKAAVVRGMGAR